MKLKKLFIGILIILLVLIAAFVIWGSTPARPNAAALAALQSDLQVKVTQDSSLITFSPVSEPGDTAFIFYPGGRVDYRAYSGALHQIAAGGFEVYSVEMPLSLAVFGINKADAIIRDHPEIENWVIAGHSLGGAMAAAYASNHSDTISGLVLWASYATESADLSMKNMPVLSISASNDGLSTPAKIKEYSQFLPTNTSWVYIEGGNHAQFGQYGLQNGDGEALISTEDQQAQIVEATTAFLKGLK